MLLHRVPGEVDLLPARRRCHVPCKWLVGMDFMLALDPVDDEPAIVTAKAMLMLGTGCNVGQSVLHVCSGQRVWLPASRAFLHLTCPRGALPHAHGERHEGGVICARSSGHREHVRRLDLASARSADALTVKDSTSTQMLRSRSTREAPQPVAVAIHV